MYSWLLGRHTCKLQEMTPALEFHWAVRPLVDTPWIDFWTLVCLTFQSWPREVLRDRVEDRTPPPQQGVARGSGQACQRP
jgi:hypothetical protein